ncbi:PREDICTED: putative transcription factor bHLH041 isoform X1 [Camelina sativa]|uniref:Transcription factor bHLH041 isoform X1 n=1 Tax=Camelina sativa TaxID=90675 RepID=A0ABM0UMK7_CAMSA|nr:PREDICTED: putative transcription factor bHLH041 isoform X1 [Camelina sativa]
MDAFFLMDDSNTRKQLISSLAHAFGCVYVCLWSYYFPRPSNYLISMDAFYNEASQEPPSSSSRSLARSLLLEYRQSLIPLHNGHVPSMAFMNNLPYVEIRQQEIQRLAYNDAQRLFYQEAKIKTVIFMGCRSGEIELGMTYDAANMKIEESLREWFPEDFNRNSSPVNSDYLRPPRHLSTSSSSLSPNHVSEYSSLLFPLIPKPSTTTDAVNAPGHPLLAPINMIHHQQQQQEPLFRNRELEEEAMTQAILAVLRGSSSPPSTSSSPLRKGRATAFKRYYCMISGGDRARPQPSVRKQSMMKRAITFYNRLNIQRRERFVRENATMAGDGSGGSGGGGRSPSTTQLHHMISERKRREKLNESFQALRSLLPPGTKKDKASVLTIAREQLSSLQGEISKLLKRNRELEAKLAGEREIGNDLQPDERFNVCIRHIPESTSRERMLDLRVVLREDIIRVDDLMIRLLEFLKQINNVSLVSIEARSRARDSSVVLVSLRLKIEGEWDESAFQEAVRRVVADLAH